MDFVSLHLAGDDLGPKIVNNIVMDVGYGETVGHTFVLLSKRGSQTRQNGQQSRRVSKKIWLEFKLVSLFCSLELDNVEFDILMFFYGGWQ